MTSLPGGTAWVPTEEKLADILFRFTRVNNFVTDTMVPDLLAIAGVYKNDLATVGVGTKNLLSWGVFDDSSMDPAKRFFPRGAVYNAQIGQIVEPKPDQVIEYVDHSWYNAADGNLNPSVGKTNPEWTDYDVAKKYSWAKAPRLDGKSVEVGPLARMVVAYADGVAPVKKIVDDTLAALGVPGNVPILFSLLGRIGSRVLETKVIADQAPVYIAELIASIKGGDGTMFAGTTATQGAAAGLWEAPRGALGHWIDIKGGKIANYQAVTPSTWNNCPRDKDGVRGPLEEALVGAVVADPTKPVEVMRIVHSFDP
jgi:Ni,Fe-hydrogenase I large subunit